MSTQKTTSPFEQHQHSTLLESDSVMEPPSAAGT
jgi:hypothetical protein